MHVTETIILHPSDGFSSEFSIGDVQVGIVAPADGFALSGPKISLFSGVWELRVLGELSCTAEKCYLDVSTDHGVNIVLSVPLQSASGVLFEGQFQFAYPQENVEVRVYVSNQSFVRIDSVELRQGGLRDLVDYKQPISKRRMDVYQISGNRLILDRSSHVDRTLIENGEWEADQLAYLKSLVAQVRMSPRAKVFLDIGAYFGLYSMNMARTKAFDEIIAYEADPLNFRQLSGNLLLNDPFLKIEAHCVALSDKEGESSYFPSWAHPDGNRGGVGIVQGRSDSIRVPTKRLDDLVGCTERIVFAKVDVEGHEHAVLSGMKNVLTGNQCVLQVESLDLDEVGKKMKVELRASLEDLGYRVLNQIDCDVFYSNFLT